MKVVLARKGRLSQGDQGQATAQWKEAGASPSMQIVAPASGVGTGACSESVRVRVGHSPGSDEVGKVLHDLQGHAFLLPGKLPLVGRVKGQPEGILDIGQQFQAEKTHGNKEEQR